MMDYIREAVEYLKNYDNLKKAVDNLKCEILELKSDLKSVKEISYSGMPTCQISAPDDVIVNKMFRLSMAEEEYKKTLKTLKRIDKVFEDFEKDNSKYGKVLRGYFIDQYTEDEMIKDFKYSDRHLRRLKQQALKSFAIRVFGIKVIGG